MNLYIYGKSSDLSKEQIAKLKEVYKVKFIDHADFEPLYKDKTEKVIALDPDVLNWQFPNTVIDKIPNLKALCLETTGYEWVDYKYCTKKGIAVTNVPKYCTSAVAEQCVFMALALTKKYPLFAKFGKMNWEADFIGEDMTSKTAGIVGLGSIGGRVARLLNGMGMQVCHHSRHQYKEFPYVSFEDLIKKCDYIFLNVSKNEGSLKLFSDANLKKINKNACVIVTANGFEEVSKKLADMAANGKLKGVAFESNDFNLSHYNGNVFVTPFNAYYTKNSLTSMFKIWVDTILSASTKKIINTVTEV